MICYIGFLACSMFQLDMVSIVRCSIMNSCFQEIPLFYTFNKLIPLSKLKQLQSFKHFDFRIFITITAILTGISILFIYCFFGKLATESFLEMSYSLYNANWYEFPIVMQKDIILMMANMQKPIYYHGFNMAILNLETFLKVNDILI